MHGTRLPTAFSGAVMLASTNRRTDMTRIGQLPAASFRVFTALCSLNDAYDEN
jgi:hypothetical protein